MLPAALFSSHTHGNTMQVLKLRIICPYSLVSLGLIVLCYIENNTSKMAPTIATYLLTLQYSLDTIPTERWGLCPLSLKLDWLFKMNFYVENERNVTSDFWSQVIKGTIVFLLLDGILLEPLVIMYVVWIPRGYALRKPNLPDLKRLHEMTLKSPEESKLPGQSSAALATHGSSHHVTTSSRETKSQNYPAELFPNLWSTNIRKHNKMFLLCKAPKLWGNLLCSSREPNICHLGLV